MTGIHPSNADAATAWDGPAGDIWADHADQFDAGVARFMQPFLEAAAIERTMHVLDVGCGNGLTTREAARRAAAVTGVDLSARMLDIARRRAAADGLANVSFVRADVQVADLGQARYDRVISRNGVMFFGDPVAAFANLARALKPEGRMVLLVWQGMVENHWFTAFRSAVPGPLPPPDGPGPFALGDPDRVRTLLTAAGFAEPELRGVREPTYYGPDVATAERYVSTMLGGLLAELDDAGRAEATAALHTTLEEHMGPDGVTYPSAMWIITAVRAGS
ncbi:methyltransferase domain-containing protein [Pseudonocardia sp. DSM 110487]|uniref:class I SAM-dependent methyltransferase n=1 Tax=Pseudonocardia sp. DSM 110487 TaxID=2865833 RepID=UPI001C6A8078|nr:class I SAM-dependent methyltransferase [Pseudonocardia sp. DSM 110487]QYN37080.1 methyltransferase domain-containing protein [Pseudonocardia sp. DSM 110487]